MNQFFRIVNSKIFVRPLQTSKYSQISNKISNRILSLNNKQNNIIRRAIKHENKVIMIWQFSYIHRQSKYIQITLKHYLTEALLMISQDNFSQQFKITLLPLILILKMHLHIIIKGSHQIESEILMKQLIVSQLLFNWKTVRQTSTTIEDLHIERIRTMIKLSRIIQKLFNQIPNISKHFTIGHFALINRINYTKQNRIT